MAALTFRSYKAGVSADAENAAKIFKVSLTGALVSRGKGTAGLDAVRALAHCPRRERP